MGSVDLASVTVVVVRLFLVVTMLGIGAQLGSGGWIHGGAVGRWLVAMVALNVVVIPAVGLVACLALGLRGEVAIGVLACAIAPAGSLGPKLVQLARGDLARGVAATFVLSVLAVVTVPSTIALGARVAGLDASMPGLDVRSVLASLVVFQLVPMLAGVVVARWRAGIGRRLIAPLTLASNVLIGVIVIVAFVDSVDDLIAVGPLPIAVIAFVAIVGHLAGRWLGGADVGVARASGLVSAQRSPGLALLLVAGPGHPIATATVVVATFTLTVLNVGAALIYGRSSTEDAEVLAQLDASA